MNPIVLDSKHLTPSKVVCIGRNYAAHIHELGNATPDAMVLFNKPSTAITGELGYFGTDCHYETEMAFVIVAGALAGVGLGLDLTKRSEQARLKSQGLPWERAKAFDGSAVLSPFVRLPPAIEWLRFTLHVNGTMAQQGAYGLMIHKPREILAEASSFMTLCDGDVLMTGTPAGVGPYRPGDVLRAALFCGDQELLATTWRACQGLDEGHDDE